MSVNVLVYCRSVKVVYYECVVIVNECGVLCECAFSKVIVYAWRSADKGEVRAPIVCVCE